MGNNFPILGELEIRRRGGGLTISGSFGFDVLATRASGGKVRKEVFSKSAFDWSIEQAEKGEREVSLLNGHSFSQPLGSTKNGKLKLAADEKALTFTAALLAEGQNLDDLPTYAQDLIKGMELNLASYGVSPGFRVPPKSIDPKAEILEPEPGNPGVFIRRINNAVLYELSVVSRPAYPGTDVSVRQKPQPDSPKFWLWL